MIHLACQAVSGEILLSRRADIGFRDSWSFLTNILFPVLSRKSIFFLPRSWELESDDGQQGSLSWGGWSKGPSRCIDSDRTLTSERTKEVDCPVHLVCLLVYRWKPNNRLTWTVMQTDRKLSRLVSIRESVPNSMKLVIQFKLVKKIKWALGPKSTWWNKLIMSERCIWCALFYFSPSPLLSTRGRWM